MDIRSTLAKVCYKVIHDHSVDEATRVKRCKALLILAKVYLSKAGTTEAGLGDIKARLAQQMNAANQHSEEHGKGSSSADSAAPESRSEAKSAPSTANSGDYTSFDSKPSYDANSTLD